MKTNFVALYLAFICVILLCNSMVFLNDEQTVLALVGGVFSILFLLSAIGTYKDMKSFLWLGIICIASYTLYAIGAVIWALFSHSLSLLLVSVVVILTLINIYVVIKLIKRINYII
ncbi:hypothetical protein [Radiobacillus sp. PE A8.2]|uniref:hypothetical protein n=1 Tax=Radiobacillus sp. PE A8.2 TaxID=3380349 RepID=UPI003890291B